MTSNPDDIRRDIERTRADLSHNVNALADQANPAASGTPRRSVTSRACIRYSAPRTAAARG